MPITYNLHYFCYGNPQLVKLARRALMVSDEECLGFQAVGSAKGGESEHADTKRRALSGTNGHDDWAVQLVTDLIVVAMSQTDEQFQMNDLHFHAGGTVGQFDFSTTRLTTRARAVRF